MLARLLKLLLARQGEIDQRQLCAELGISTVMLQNYLDVLVRTGRISPYQPGGTACNQAENCLSSGKTCPGPEECPLLMLAPRQISITFEEPSQLLANRN
jgi:hypothetical protein